MSRHCTSCGVRLQKRKEKITGVCYNCAVEAHKGFSQMGKGNFKKGIKRVMDVKFARDPKQREESETRIQKALQYKRKTVRRKLQEQVKKGKITQEQMDEGMKQFEDHYNPQNEDENGA